MTDNHNRAPSFARKIAERALVLAEPYVYADRVDDAGEVNRPRGLHAAGVRVNQALIEAGRTPPWIFSAEECRAFWSSRTVGGDSNDPLQFSRKDPAIVDFLAHFWSPEVTTADRILELGCNAGGNLSRLHELGYTNLAGVDINAVSLEMLPREHPRLAGVVELMLGSFEDVLPRLETAAYDTVFTMAVGIHIHPSSRSIFGEMARVARRRVCVLETEVANARYTFARSYRRVFERLGCTQVREEHIDRRSHPEVSREFDGYVARLFRVGAH
ncbi:MAG TPA: class I SAM-dependent methyltransferase [Gaiellaceae bacterium]|nr:class I SAM-dependent methyltransferase [Gaiellaceae bacterium]